ncbi:hypothetical protein H4S01_005129, partial [Coemansia sp. RSA 2610]
MAENNTNNANTSNGGDEDTLASFTNFDADGIGADAANLFGSFTNDSARETTSDSIFGQLSATDLNGFNVDLTTLDIGNGGDGNMDLSSIQLMNLDEVPMSGGSSNQQIASPDDAAQMMAQLLGPSTHAAISSTLAAAAATTTVGPQSTLATAAAAAAASATLQAPAPTAQPNKPHKSRSSSQSSSDM